MSTTISTDERILSIWEWCRDAFSQYGIKLSFPLNTDPSKTYQWRFAKSIANKFDAWNFDEETSKKFIHIAVAHAKSKNILKKGLAALHQNNMLEYCYKVLTSQQLEFNSQIETISRMKLWIDSKIGDNDPMKVLLNRQDKRSLPNIIIWYQSSQLSDVYIALSKSCSKALNKITDMSEKRLLPSISALYLIRSEFLSEANNKRQILKILGKDIANCR